MAIELTECGGCGGCGCDFDVWTISASQSLVGYAGFACEGSQPSDSRYLQYNVSCDAGFTGNWCGGGAQPTSVNITTQIDPFTGLTCTQGLPPNGYSCAGGTNCEKDCSETSKTYTCEAREEDCAGEGVETIQTRYSLSGQNNMDAVIGRATSLLNSFGVGSLPGPNTSGEVKVGSGGQAVLAWQAFSGEPSASRWTSSGVAALKKSVVKLKRDLRYKIVSYDQYGTESEQEFDGVKDELIYLDPPSSDGSKYFRSGQACQITAVTSEVESTNQLTTKTLRTAPPPADGDEPEDQPCTSFIIGPDCKAYTTRVTTISGSSSSTRDAPWGTETSSANGTVTSTATACQETTVNNTSSSNYSYEDKYYFWASESFTCSNGVRSFTDPFGTWPIEDDSPCYSPGCATSNCIIKCGSGSYSDSTSNSWVDGPQQEYANEESHSVNESCSSSPYGGSTSTSSNSKFSQTSEGSTLSDTTDTSCNATTTIVYSGPVNDAFDAEDARFDTQSWTQQGGLCAWKALATNGTMNESTADITIYVSVDGDPQKNYNVEVQMVVESNTTQNNCSFRSYDAYVESLTMKGREVRQAGRYLSANNGQTKCMVHNAAVAYEA